MLQLEKKLFDYFNQEVFRDDNGTAVSPAFGCVVLPRPTRSVASALPGPRWVRSQTRGQLLNPHHPITSLLSPSCCVPVCTPTQAGAPASLSC